MQILNGQELSQKLRLELTQKVSDFKALHGRTPKLAAILLGSEAASQIYIRNKGKFCQEVGLGFELVEDPSGKWSQDEVAKVIEGLNQRQDIDGILLQLPLPKGLQSEVLLEKIDKWKDVDGLTQASQGALFQGSPTFVPCTPFGVQRMLKEYGHDISGKNVVIVGRSNVVGKPMAHLALQDNATVTVCHSKTPSMREYTTKADVVIVAAGKPKFLGKDDFKKDAVVIDVGIHHVDGKICGDVRANELDGWVKAVSPVPKGVGPMTIWGLLYNTYQSAVYRESRQANK